MRCFTCHCSCIITLPCVVYVYSWDEKLAEPARAFFEEAKKSKAAATVTPSTAEGQ